MNGLAAIQFAVNGERVSVPGDVSPNSNLADFIRTHTRFKGPKIGCGEGGCGACAVEVSYCDAETGKVSTRSINSCLAPIGGLGGAAVTTVEGLGNSTKGFHPIQERFAGFHASQCGFCTPGFVVAAHGVVRRAAAAGKGTPTADDFAAGLDGNLCRCTGYRPIIDACKSLTGCADLEDLGICAPRCGHTAATVADTPFPDFLLSSQPAGIDASNCTGSCNTCPSNAACHSSLGHNQEASQQPPDAAAPPSQQQHHGQSVWRHPRSLQQLHVAVSGVKPADLRLLAGNTGSGVYKNWPVEPVVVDIRGIAELDYLHRTSEGTVEVGAVTTLTQLADQLQGSDSDGWHHMAKHLLRIAGTHVRNAATVGGNLALSRTRQLESDLSTVLMGAGASVRFLDLATCGEGSNGANKELDIRSVSVEDFLARKGDQLLVVGVSVPPFPSSAVFRSHKVSQRFFNSHAIANMALSYRVASDGQLSDVRFAVGTFDKPALGEGTWSARRQPAVEKALSGAALSVENLCAALRAIRGLDDSHTGTDAAEGSCRGQDGRIEGLNVQLVQGMLLSALAPFLQDQVEGDGQVARLLKASAMQPPGAGSATQSWPAYDQDAPPVYLPVEKDAVRLQASGEATYTSDIGVGTEQLYAATVPSSHARAYITKIDLCAAEEVPGFVAFIGESDVPKGGNGKLFGDQLFAGSRVEYHGQRIGLAIATSQRAAEDAAAAVEVTYSSKDAQGQNELPPPVLTLEDAAAANSYHDCPDLRDEATMEAESKAARVEAALEAAPHCIRGAHYTIGSQSHFYMEPQAAVAVPDEGGTITVHSATQSLDAVQRAVANTLGVAHHQVKVVCRRVGGAFGGKSSRQMPPAAAAAVAAAKLRRPVRYVLNRNDDMRLNAGRCPTDIKYDVAFDGEGKLKAVRIHGILSAGAVEDLASQDGLLLKQGACQAYDIPELEVHLKLARLNLPPHTIMRGPGFLQAVMVIEQVLEHVAAYLGVDATEVKMRNFISAPDDCQDESLASVPSDASRPCFTGPAAGLDGGEGQQAGEGAPAEGPPEGDSPPAVMKTGDGKQFLASLFTLPRLWQQLQEKAEFRKREKEVTDFNAANAWRKRGIAITPVRFDCTPPAMAGGVHVYADGSVTLTTGGLEMGQGLFTKIKQVAAHELGKVAGEALPLSLVRVADSGSEGHPSCGTTWSSTGSEGACQSVKLACAKVVKALQPIVKDAKKGATWQDIISAAQGDADGFTPTRVPLSATAWWDGSDVEGPQKGRRQLAYVAFGAAISEVEIDVLTGEKSLLRTDILFDCGHSINPGVDIGQVEGAFVMGAGIQTLEEVVTDAHGRLVTDGTWHYKIPTYADIPRQFNVAFLEDSPNPRGVMSSKASGEPSLMLSTSVLTALQNAVAAARQEVDTPGLGAQAWSPLPAPATTARLREAVGTFDVASMLQAAIHHNAAGGCGSPASDSSWELL